MDSIDVGMLQRPHRGDSRAAEGWRIDVNVQDSNDGYTALMWACSRCRKGVALELLKVGGFDVNVQDSGGWTALTWACSRCRKGVVRKLMKVDGLDINLQNRGGETALIMACSNGVIKVALELLKVDGLDVNVQNSGGWTALTGHAPKASQRWL